MSKDNLWNKGSKCAKANNILYLIRSQRKFVMYPNGFFDHWGIKLQN